MTRGQPTWQQRHADPGARRREQDPGRTRLETHREPAGIEVVGEVVPMGLEPGAGRSRAAAAAPVLPGNTVAWPVPIVRTLGIAVVVWEHGLAAAAPA